MSWTDQCGMPKPPPWLSCVTARQNPPLGRACVWVLARRADQAHKTTNREPCRGRRGRMGRLTLHPPRQSHCCPPPSSSQAGPPGLGHRPLPSPHGPARPQRVTWPPSTGSPSVTRDTHRPPAVQRAGAGLHPGAGFPRAAQTLQRGPAPGAPLTKDWTRGPVTPGMGPPSADHTPVSTPSEPRPP